MNEASRPTVAVIGASADRRKFGNKSVRAHAQQGYDVYPVNPRGGVIEGLTVYQTVGDIPIDALDRISVYLPPHLTMSLIEEIAATGCREFWLNPGSESEALIENARALGLNVIRGCSIVDVGCSPADFGDD